jgi:hypothetical protein
MDHAGAAAFIAIDTGTAADPGAACIRDAHDRTAGNDDVSFLRAANPCSKMFAMRRESVSVFPVPAGARSSMFWSKVFTTFCWSGFSAFMSMTRPLFMIS